MKRTRTLVVMCMCVCASAGLLTSACSGARQAPVSVKRLKVNLPRTPPLKLVQPKLKTTSGAYTVAGLFDATSGLLGSEVVVEAVVLSRHVCVAEETAEPGDDSECYPPPHLTLADDLASTRQTLLVVGGNRQLMDIEEGGSVTLKGTFRQWSREKVFVRSAGLLQLAEEAPPEDEAQRDK